MRGSLPEAGLTAAPDQQRSNVLLLLLGLLLVGRRGMRRGRVRNCRMNRSRRCHGTCHRVRYRRMRSRRLGGMCSRVRNGGRLGCMFSRVRNSGRLGRMCSRMRDGGRLGRV